MPFTKQEQTFIDYLDSITDSSRDLSIWENKPKRYYKEMQEIQEVKKEFFQWFRKQLTKNNMKKNYLHDDMADALKYSFMCPIKIRLKWYQKLWRVIKKIFYIN